MLIYMVNILEECSQYHSWGVNIFQCCHFKDWGFACWCLSCGHQLPDKEVTSKQKRSCLFHHTKEEYHDIDTSDANLPRQPSCHNRMLVVHISATRFQKVSLEVKWLLNWQVWNRLIASKWRRFLLCSKMIVVDIFFNYIFFYYYFARQGDNRPFTSAINLIHDLPGSEKRSGWQQRNGNSNKAQLVMLRRTAPTFIMAAKLLPVVTVIIIYTYIYLYI